MSLPVDRMLARVVFGANMYEVLPEKGGHSKRRTDRLQTVVTSRQALS